jgi:hypothetical protein
MKEHFFGYVKEDSCPNCGTPRVGVDYDDSFSIRAGILHPAVKPTCTFGGWIPKSDKWFAEYKVGYELKYVSRFVEPTTCPCCGGQVKEGTIDGLYYDGLGRLQVRHIRAWVCENTQGKSAYVEDLPCCPHCEEVHSI